MKTEIDSIQEIAKQCVQVIAGKQTELDQTRIRLEGALEGVSFLLNSILEAQSDLETEDGKNNQPIRSAKKA
jgi:hypothetical protein